MITNSVNKRLPATLSALLLPFLPPAALSACSSPEDPAGDGDAGDGDIGDGDAGDGDAGDGDVGDGDIGDGDGDVGDGDVGDGDAGDGDGDVVQNGVPVTLTFRAQVGEEMFQCGTTYTGQGATAVDVTPQDFRFYVSSVRLIDVAGNEVPVVLDEREPWQASDVALLDFEDGTAGCSNGNPQMNATVTGTVPEGTYVGLVFSPSVPLELNHADPATLPAPLQAGGMSWGWLLGYRFLRAELAAADGGAGAGVFHLGSSACSPVVPDAGSGGGTNGAPTTQCARPNRPEIRIAEGFTPEGSVIVADIGAMMRETDLGVPGTCHSNESICSDYFPSVGLEYPTGDRLETQTTFRAVTE